MNDTSTPLYTDQSDEKGIVLNRMYTGSYLSSNLGHEVINMFQADDDNYYLYLNAKGNFAAEGNKVGTMLLVRGIGKGSIEVVGMATKLKRVNSANNPLSRDLGVINEQVRKEQDKFLESITYGTVPILKIFGKGGQQSIYVSYWVTKDDFYTPKEGVRIIIEFPPQKKNNDDNYEAKFDAYIASEPKEVKKEDDKTTITIRLKDYNFASTSLHQYILENKNQDLTHLSDVCNAKDDEEKLLYWESKNRKINSSENVDRREVSLFDICEIQNDENRFSNALSYFMIKYKDIWQRFFKEQLKIEEEIEIVSVTREEDAKVDKDPWKGVTGGRVDLLIRTNNSYIIIENKIDSSIIENEVNGEKITQLERYYNYVEYLKYEEVARIRGEIAKLEKDKEKPSAQYDDPKKKHWKNWVKWGETVNKLDSEINDLKNKSSEIANRKILGYVLSPNYNKPSAQLLEICKRPDLNVDWYEINHNIQPFTWLSYNEMYKWLSEEAKTYLEPGEEYDANFKAFHDAMKKHTYDYENLALFEEMKNTFFTRIQECSTPMPKYFTKSAFAISLECPRRLYYAYDSEHYANQDIDDEFLKSLAEGGFQVGEFAKLCYGIEADNMVGTLDSEDAIAKTVELLKQENVNIAEAAFRVGNMFVRADIIEKKGNIINLIEVKAKSWNPNEDSFVAKNGKSTNKAIRPYLYDVAFQKYVIVQALREMFPQRDFTVNAFLMLADKSRNATVNGLNQLFKIFSAPGKRSVIETAVDAQIIVNDIPPADRVVRAFDVNEICDKIIAGDYAEQQDAEFMMGLGFERFVNKMSDDYCNHRKTDCIIGSKCFGCPFHKKSDDKSRNIFDGYCECWVEKAGFDPSATDKPLIKEMSGQYIGTKRDDFVKTSKYFMENLTDADLARHSGKSHRGLDHYERKWLQIGVATNNEDVLKEYRHNMIGDTYLDVPGIKEEMKEWKFPLHFIDFETSAVALPFYDKMRPYEQIAFQFSHHRVDMNEDGTYKVTHAGQFINTEKGHFPNFDFIRALKAELDQDEGTIFRYSNHENTILREIHRQLDARNEPDKKELQDFIDSITHYEEGKVKYVGDRDMVDLADVVLKYYFHPIMKGSYSIKVVLPAVQNSSGFIKEKYSKPVYGTPDMPSANLTEPKVWIEYGPDGSVLSPYKLLPPVSSYLGIETDLDERELNLTESIANGGAALAAYAKMQFSDDTMSEALKKALLTYCELDTLAMVFIWEYFYHEC